MTSVVNIPSSQFNRRKNANENSAVTDRQHLQIALEAKETLYWNATHTSFRRKGYTERGEWGRSDILWKWTKIYATSVSFVFSACEGTPMTISELKPHLLLSVLKKGLLLKANRSDNTYDFGLVLYWRQGKNMSVKGHLTFQTGYRFTLNNNKQVKDICDIWSQFCWCNEQLSVSQLYLFSNEK